MIVECPACRTRYRTDSTGVVDGETFFECSQEGCGNIFPYSPSLLRGENSPLPSPLAFSSASFPEKEETAESATLGQSSPEEAWADTPSAADGPFDFDSPEESEESEEKPAHQPSDRFPDEELDTFPPTETPFYEESEEDAENRFILTQPEVEPASEFIISRQLLFLLLGALLLGYAGLGYYALSHLEDTEALLARVPLVGSLFTTERFSAQHIALMDLKGSFWLTKDNRRVFAISGKAVNNATVSVRSIQVEGTIYDAEGEVAGQQMIFCGTETAPTVLESLTVREMSILQNLVPPKQFHVAAGQAVNFLIVFPDPPPAVAELGCRVVSAQFGTS